MPDYRTAYIGLGSNTGEPEKKLAEAREMVPLATVNGHESFCGIQYPLKLLQVSSVYRTAPQDYAEQPYFYNQVLALGCRSHIFPEQLLAHLQAIENALGRTRSGLRFGPRVIDLDLLLFGSMQIRTPNLEVPHPRMTRRAFVLVPLAEIAPDLLLPSGVTVATARDTLNYTRDGWTLVQ